MTTGTKVEWDVRMGDRLLGSRRGEVIAAHGDYVAIKTDIIGHDHGDPFLSRHKNSVREIA